jgi:hypothetical protein
MPAAAYGTAMAGGRSTADGVAAVGPENLSATLAGDRGLFGMGRVKVPGPKISSIHGTGTPSRSIPLEASSLAAAWNKPAAGPRPAKRAVSVLPASG